MEETWSIFAVYFVVHCPLFYIFLNIFMWWINNYSNKKKNCHQYEIWPTGGAAATRHLLKCHSIRLCSERKIPQVQSARFGISVAKMVSLNIYMCMRVCVCMWWYQYVCVWVCMHVFWCVWLSIELCIKLYQTGSVSEWILNSRKLLFTQHRTSHIGHTHTHTHTHTLWLLRHIFLYFTSVVQRRLPWHKNILKKLMRSIMLLHSYSLL